MKKIRHGDQMADVTYAIKAEIDDARAKAWSFPRQKTMAVPLRKGVERQTPRVSIDVKRLSLAKRRLGRAELKPFTDWKDDRPETELNFKFYRQATDKIVGLTDGAAAFLRRCC